MDHLRERCVEAGVKGAFGGEKSLHGTPTQRSRCGQIEQSDRAWQPRLAHGFPTTTTTTPPITPPSPNHQHHHNTLPAPSPIPPTSNAGVLPGFPDCSFLVIARCVRCVCRASAAAAPLPPDPKKDNTTAESRDDVVLSADRSGFARSLDDILANTTIAFD